MGITETMGLFKFAVLCIHLLAWPVLALGYPLYASIKAVESGSNYHLKKMVIYWTLFSLFCLFEFAFVKFIEWIPFWSSVRLVVIFWLVMPQFDGACYAYHGLVRPVLLVKLQEVIHRFCKLKEDRLCKRETLLDLVEKYIKENGSETLEKLIALEHESQKCINSQRDAKILDSEGKSIAAISKQLNEANAARRDTEMLEATGKSAATKTQAQYARSVSSAWVLKGTDVTNVKDMTPLEASAKNRCPETPPLKQTQREWTCDLCTTEAMTEITLNAHLQGSKHKSKLESLKTSMLDAKDTRPSPLLQHTQPVSAAWDLKETAEKRRPDPPLKKAQQERTWVTTTSKPTLKPHLQQNKHMSKLGTLKASTHGAKDTCPSPSGTSKLNHDNVAKKFIKECGSDLEKLIAIKNEREGCNNSLRDIRVVDSDEKNGSATSQKVQYSPSIKAVWIPKGTDGNDEVKKMTPSETSAETPPLRKAQEEWSCDTDLCKETLNACLQGSVHKSMFDSTKRSKLPHEDTEVSAWATCKANQGNLVGTENKDGEGSLKKSQKFKHRCTVCDVKVISDVDLASHLKGKRHSSNLQALIS